MDLISKKIYIPTRQNIEQEIKESRFKIIDKYIADRHLEGHDVDLNQTTETRLFDHFYEYIESQFSDSKVIETFFIDREYFNMDYNLKFSMYGMIPFRPYIDYLITETDDSNKTSKKIKPNEEQEK